jgi:hypothetical protein
MFDAGSSRDREYVLTARQHPGERELCRGAGFAPRDAFEWIEQTEIGCKLAAFEARH